jgi:hypothetical protein
MPPNTLAGGSDVYIKHFLTKIIGEWAIMDLVLQLDVEDTCTSQNYKLQTLHRKSC